MNYCSDLQLPGDEHQRYSSGELIYTVYLGMFGRPRVKFVLESILLLRSASSVALLSKMTKKESVFLCLFFANLLLSKKIFYRCFENCCRGAQNYLRN